MTKGVRTRAQRVVLTSSVCLTVLSSGILTARHEQVDGAVLGAVLAGAVVLAVATGWLLSDRTEPSARHEPIATSRSLDALLAPYDVPEPVDIAA